ncbi:MAG: methionyl-tRNA formyltransferase [Deltaproteobacteria bacterium RIFOXYD12_FULL_57_12]|nr:MAG: methionyl-tRNA formyltransferase [Deltaproteobacteria bacterium RIFOXYD12_FULL_57_12]
MGTPEFAVPTLQALLGSAHSVVAVVTQPDRPKGRGRKLAAPPVKELADRAGLPVLQPTRIRNDIFLNEIKMYDPDLIVVAAYGRILPGPLLSLPPLGTINVHGSILPRYRGAAPIQWAIIRGETESGVTIMQMDEGMDTGDILLIEKTPIAPEDTAGILYGRLAELGGQALLRALDLLAVGRLTAVKQDDRQATLAPLLAKEQGLVDWQQPAAVISCLIRGLDPWPTTYTYRDGRRLRLFSPRVVKAAEPLPPPGTLWQTDAAGLYIATGEDLLLIREVQPEGGRRMPADDFRRGHALAAGLVFGSGSDTAGP